MQNRKTCRKTSSKFSLIPTAVAYLSADGNTWHQARAILDTGSETNLISSECAKRVGMHISPMNSSIAGVGGNASTQVQGCSCSMVQQRYGCPNLLIPFFVVSHKVTLDLPSVPLPRSRWPHLNDLDLADPQFHTPNAVDIILSGDVLNTVQLQATRPSLRGSPVAHLTSLGWLVSGGYSSTKSSTVHFSSECASGNDSEAMKSEPLAPPKPQCFSELGSSKQTVDPLIYSLPKIRPSTMVLAPASVRSPSECRIPPPEYAELLDQMFRIESVEDCSPYTQEELKAEELFRKTISRSADGRFVVSLPFEENPSSLGRSKPIALRRMNSLEHLLSKSTQAWLAYNLFMLDYLNAGHMEFAPPLDPRQPHYYLPHNSVHREGDPPEKIRVVFNASQKTTSQLSLNDVLLPGPKLQLNITELLTRFCQDKFIFVADIRQMFRQISHPRADRDYLRILWMFSPEEELKEYRLCTVTYGTTSAPYLANRVLREEAEIYGPSHPNAADILWSRIYVDDLNGGIDDLNSALLIRKELQDVLGHAQLELRKWAANDPRLLVGIPTEHVLPTIMSVSIEDETGSSMKVLGLSWQPQTDTFHFVLQPLENICTKRQLSSQIARVYAPLGWLMPVTITARNIFRVVVQNHYGWDEDLPPSVIYDWSRLAQELPELTKLHIPRHVPAQNQWLIGFADASELAYGAVVYAISQNEAGFTSSLIVSKARMAPIKAMTLPRLELCAAQLLARTVTKTVPTLVNVHCDQVILLNDSEIALSWITAKNPPVWKVFVGNRVSDILEHTDENRWFHVASQDNPADHASQGLRLSELIRCHQWFSGPEWLCLPFDQWPVRKVQTTPTDKVVLSEARSSTIRVSAVSALTHGTASLEERFSSLRTLQNVVGFCVRYLNQLRIRRSAHQKNELRSRYQSLDSTNLQRLNWSEQLSPLSVEELRNAQSILVRRAQAQALSTEITDAQTNRPKLKITRSLGLFMDPSGTLRVRGRLRNSQLPDTQKHPALLPSNHTLTKLLIQNSHQLLYHAGPLATLHHLRSQSRIINGKNVVRRQLAKCVLCYTVRPKPFQPEMGQLPSDRTIIDFPFATTGVDYAGPFPVSIAGLRRNKTLDCYLAIFVCFVTKAVHVEVVTDLTTPGFPQAFHRFIARRGNPHTIWSDNGRNFLGAANELKRVCNLILSPDHQSAVLWDGATRGTTWKFIPLSAPFFGGLWEAAVKQAKRLLKNCLRDQVPTLETLSTIVTQVEAVLNSRPLTAMSSSPDDMSVLTPTHFLIFRPLTLPPSDPNLYSRTSLKDRHSFTQHVLQTFWGRWKKEYLLEIQSKSKWETSARPACVGDIVLVINENTPPLSWTMGRIIGIYPGAVRPGSQIYAHHQEPFTLTRPLRKLCPLPEDVTSGASATTVGEDVSLLPTSQDNQMLQFPNQGIR